MKKILLGTSALIGAATLFSGVALADDPKVTIGGFSTFEAGWEHSDFTSGTGFKNHEVAFRNDNEIHFNVAGKTDQGLGYGAEIDLQADINGAGSSSTVGGSGSSNSGIVARRTYGWLQGDQWGHIEYGSNDSAARNLKVDASNIARATGGIDGDFIFFANANSTGGAAGTAGAFTGGSTAANVSRANFVTAPRLPVESGPASSFASDIWGNDTKITYYTPRFSGFQLGVSYTPELVDRGELTNTAVATAGNFGASNIWSGGLNYENQFDQIGVAAAVTGETGKSDDAGSGVASGPNANLSNIRAWNAGAKLSYMGFSAAGSYGDWNDSLATTGTSADYWTGGLAYETGPLGASVTYLGSETDFPNEENKFWDVSVGVDYKLAPGLTPFIEYTYFDLDPTGSAATANGASENKGNVVIVGSQLSF